LKSSACCIGDLPRIAATLFSEAERSQVPQRRDDGVDPEARLQNRENPANDLKCGDIDGNDSPRQKQAPSAE
jgi:hypothetical protein